MSTNTYIQPIFKAIRSMVENYEGLHVDYIVLADESEEWFDLEIGYRDGDEDREAYMYFDESNKAWNVTGLEFYSLETAVFHALYTSTAV